jgi:hypothetical protein
LSLLRHEAPHRRAGGEMVTGHRSRSRWLAGVTWSELPVGFPILGVTGGNAACETMYG